MTLAELKREAKAGKIKFEMIERYGKTGDEIPEYCRGIREVARVNTVAIILVTADGKESELRFDSAKLVEYDGKSLTIYAAGERDITAEEQAVLDGAKKIMDMHLKVNPYGDGGFWERKQFYKSSPCPWMSGYETVRGKRYNYNGKVVDNSIKGKAILRYTIHHV